MGLKCSSDTSMGMITMSGTEESQLSLEWIAGFFDGEGCFHLGKQTKNGKEHPKFTVIIGQSGDNGKRVLEQIQKQLGGNLYLHLSPGQHKAKKEAYKLYWNAKEALVLIDAILPYLVLKKEEAQKVKQYIERKKNGS